MFGKRLRKIRNQRGFTQQRMADLLSIALITYQKYEQGVRNPSFECLVSIANILDVSIDYLLGRDDFLRTHGISFEKNS